MKRRTGNLIATRPPDYLLSLAGTLAESRRQVAQARSDHLGLSQLLAAVVLLLLTGCVGDTSDGSAPPEWAIILFSNIDGLTLIEASDIGVEYELRGRASDMAQVIMSRLTEGEDFMLHGRLMITGAVEQGQVQVVWTSIDADPPPGSGDGTWNVEATLTPP
jgi:hypothetical protein